jgi:hypothetical protein
MPKKMVMIELPTVEVLRETFSYDPKTGDLYWKIPRGRHKAGKKVNINVLDRYARVVVNGKSYRVHRVIWKHYHGEDPGQLVIDHLNGNTKDNRITNLRACTSKENNLNTARHREVLVTNRYDSPEGA